MGLGRSLFASPLTDRAAVPLGTAARCCRSAEEQAAPSGRSGRPFLCAAVLPLLRPDSDPVGAATALGRLSESLWAECSLNPAGTASLRGLGWGRAVLRTKRSSEQRSRECRL